MALLAGVASPFHKRIQQERFLDGREMLADSAAPNTEGGRAEKFPARARLLSGEERAKAYAQAVQVFPLYSEYQQKTAREIPIFLLKRVKEDA